MKIAPKGAEAFLAAPSRQHRAALLYGPDSGLVRQRAKRLTATLLSGNDDPFALTELSEAALIADPARLADELSAVSLMGGNRVIIIAGAGDKLTRIVEGASDRFHESVFLIVSADELSTRSSLRAWFEKENLCAALACYQDEARDVQALARKTFEDAGINAGRDIVEYLSQLLGNDRGVTQQELEKIVTYAGEAKEITLKEVEALVDYNRDTGSDDVVTALADRNLQQLEKMLTLLLSEGVQPVSYLRAAQRYFNRLYYIRGQVESGQSPEAVISGLRPPVFFRQVPIMTRHAGNWTTAQLAKALKLLVSAELACKTSDLPAIAASSRRLLQVTQVR